jgi:hypothetical protein
MLYSPWGGRGVREKLSWQLLSMKGVSEEKIRKNLREASTFIQTSIDTIKEIALSYNPLEFILYAHSRATGEDGQSGEIHSRLISYLVELLPYWNLSHKQEDPIPSKDWKRLVQSFEELLKKSIRYADNTSLLLYREKAIESDELLLAFQQEALTYILPPLDSIATIDELFRALQYRLQPFNALVGEVFRSRLDGLLGAFRSLAAVQHTGDLAHYDVVETTGLIEHDAHLLSVELGSRTWDDASHRLSDTPITRSHPFIRLRSSYYCFDGAQVLRDGYRIIKDAVCRQGEEYRSRWEEVEEAKCRLLPITFFTAMLSTMDYQRDLPVDGGVIDAVFEREARSLIIQIPTADLARTWYNPFTEAEALLGALQRSLDSRSLALNQRATKVIIDMLSMRCYPLKMDGGTLNLSFVQLANLASTWEGVQKIKDTLETANRPDWSVATAFFSTLPSEATINRALEDEEEAADEIVSFAEQPELFSFDDEYYPLDDDLDYELESEAIDILEPPSVADDWQPEEGGGLQFADEEMEAGVDQPALSFYDGRDEDDDEDELLTLIYRDRQEAAQLPNPTGFMLVDAVSKAAAPPKIEPPTEIVTPPKEVDPTLPPRLGEVMSHLDVVEKSVLLSYVESGERDLIDGIESLIIKAQHAHRLDGREKMFSVPDLRLTVVVSTTKGDAMDAWDRRNSVGAIMYLRDASVWNLLLLQYDRKGVLTWASERSISRDEFSSADWKYVVSLAHRIQEKQRS